MNDLLFASDLLNLFRHDAHYSDQKRLTNALRKFQLPCNEHDNFEQMVRTFAVHLLEKYGESEPFLTGSFISAEALIRLLKEKSLPIPDVLRPAIPTNKAGKGTTDPAQFENDFDLLCRNCGTVTDPLGNNYRTPIGRLIFRTYLETLRDQGVKTSAWYIHKHLKDFDTDKIVTAVEEDYVTWKTADDKEKMTSVHTIAKFILILDREAGRILGH